MLRKGATSSIIYVKIGPTSVLLSFRQLLRSTYLLGYDHTCLLKMMGMYTSHGWD